MTKRVPFHPFLLAIFPIIALLGNNISQVSLDVVVRPLAVALAATLVLYVILRLALRDALKAGLITSLFVFLFFTYGQVYNLLKQSPLTGLGLVRHRYLMIIYAGLFILGLVLILRGRKDLRPATQTLNLVGLVLLLFPVFQVSRFLLTTHSAHLVSAKYTPQSTFNVAARQGNRPDVYYIILDGYGRADMIQKAFGYDNTPFLDQLRQLGFVVAGCSRSNYNITHPSLTSSLNMEFMSTIYQSAKEQGISQDNIWTFLKDNQVRKQFKSLGYKIVAFDTGYEFTRWEDADLYLSQKTTPSGVQYVTPFESLLLDSTMVSVYTDQQTQALRNKVTEQTHPLSFFINQELFKFSELPKIADIADPTFTFAHILIPHYPFVFSPEGILTDPGYFGNGVGMGPMTPEYLRKGYVDEIRYENEQLIPILTYILKKSSPPPIIVIQGDHGYHEWGDNRLAILNAYYLPGDGKEKIYPTISPVNTFRVIFDTYFGGTYPLLPDTGYADDDYLHNPPTPESSPACMK